MNKKICYIVGAGFTKSLETGREFRVPLMTDFIDVLADHLDSNVVLTAEKLREGAGL